MARDPTLPRLTWDDSVAWCRSLPGSVFLPQTLEDFDWMVEVFRSKYEDGYMFFPLNDKEKEGDFVWVNGSCKFVSFLRARLVSLLLSMPLSVSVSVIRSLFFFFFFLSLPPFSRIHFH